MRTPLATYRLQFHAGFGFDQAAEIFSYLRELGITDIYASPIFRAGPRSIHGYDVVDPLEINPELGGADGFERARREAARQGLGWIQDIVPNHMAVTSDNRMLMDVLENGPASRYYRFFDIDWDHPYEDIKGVLLLPFLGKTYGEALESGELVLRYGEEGLSVGYYDFRFPLRIVSYARVFDLVRDRLLRVLGREHPDLIKLLGILYVLKNLSGVEDPDDRADQISFIKRMLWELYRGNREIGASVDAVLRALNGEPGRPESFDELDRLLAEQHFKLSFWKVATQEINYRRFFNINGLISLRVEDEDVFAHTHALILDLARQGAFTGLRIDHIDGLLDPTGYLKRLRDRAGDAYIVVEKILEPDEELPVFWPVQGTSGYDFVQHLTYLFCRTGSGTAFSRLYRALTARTEPFDEVVYQKKALILDKDMAGDLEDLAHHVKTIASRDRRGSDITLQGLKRALAEVLALFPVYRTYITPDVLRPADRDYIRHAIGLARRRSPDLLYELGFLERFLLLETDGVDDEALRDWTRYAMRFQQLSGPLMAKGFEDTTLYVYNRLLSLNEVGGNPGRFGEDMDRWHEYCRLRAERWPLAMSASSTHDTKRGEDARARLNVLSEIPDEWRAAAVEWMRVNRRHKASLSGHAVPDLNDEYFLYQTLLGAWPPELLEPHERVDEGCLAAFRERIKEYVIKAVREAKVHTEWIKPDTGYEEAFLGFIDKILDSNKKKPFVEVIRPFAARIAFYGFLGSLSQTILKIAAPGVPDFYQGSELWNLSLVDPDNRRPVDFTQRRRLLGELKEAEAAGTLPPPGLLERWKDGAAKLFLAYRGLKARAARPKLFLKGSYLPLAVEGRRAGHVVAFARRLGPEWAVCAAPIFLTSVVGERFPLGREAWDDTLVLLPENAPAAFTDTIAGGHVEARRGLPARELFASFPAALLLSS